MADMYPKPLSRLIAAFEMFPGIGRKMASRLAFHLLTMDDERIQYISESIRDAKAGLSYCSVCCNITQKDPCDICSSGRDHSVICVMSSVKDLMAMERTCEYDGVVWAFVCKRAQVHPHPFSGKLSHFGTMCRESCNHDTKIPWPCKVKHGSGHHTRAASPGILDFPAF